jgi:hypothetical protein
MRYWCLVWREGAGKLCTVMKLGARLLNSRENKHRMGRDSLTLKRSAIVLEGPSLSMLLGYSPQCSQIRLQGCADLMSSCPNRTVPAAYTFSIS